MTLKIERVSDKDGERIQLSGALRSDRLDQVKGELKRGGLGALDLQEVDRVDIEAIRFLNTCEDEGISVLNCLPYVREWMARERAEDNARTDWR